MSRHICLLLAMIATVPAHSSTRERISINADWRFHSGDPIGGSAGLLYDVLPQITEGNLPLAKVIPVGGILKPWILPTANAFIKDPAQRHVRPESNPGGALPYVSPDFDDRGWRSVNLPHDWAIQGPFLTSGNYGGMGRLKTWGPVWYRRKLDISAADKGRSIFLDIDGAMSYATVWLNGRLVGGWPYGYASWRVDLTPYLEADGRNQLAIRLDNPPDSARWYPGAGLYRNVWLTKTEKVHVGHWGTYVTTPQVSKSSATVALKVTVDNDSGQDQVVDVATKIYVLSPDGRKLGGAVASVLSNQLKIGAMKSAEAAMTTAVANPRLWGPAPFQKPNRYVALTTISLAGKAIDQYETPFGIRTVRFDPDHGVFVNDQHVPLKGVNEHHDLGALGAAFNVRAAERKIELLQEMGCNAIRMSHNPPAPELLDLADRMGILVIDEIFDSWERKKTAYDFHLIFPDWHEPDLRAFMRRDRNHPSVILWSVGNEVGEQLAGEEGAAISKMLVSIARNEDMTRPVMTAMNYSKPDMPLPTTVDVISLNYQGIGIRAIPGNFPDFHKKFQKVLLSSESAAALSTRGAYLFPVSPAISGPVRTGAGGDPVTQEVSGYELYAADFGSSADKSFAAHDQNPYVAGEFVWTGWDYIGEPTPYYGARSSYFGSIDLAGFKKDRFYLYQAHWRPELPMAHILPHWCWPDRVGQVTPVHVFTSGDEAELFVNGKSQGRKKKGPFEYRLRWDDVVYQPGEVSVIAYKNGKEWARSSVKTADAAAKLEAVADRQKIKNDGQDLSFVTVRITDGKGNCAPRANNRIRFSVEGPGEIVGTDNGDPTSFEPFPSAERKAFNGLCLVIVRAKRGESGKINLRADSDSLQGVSMTLEAASK